MINVLTNRRLSRAVSAALLCGVLAVGLAVNPAVSLAATGAVAAAPAAATGLGFWAAMGCMGCIGGFVIGGGLTVVGMAFFVAANPELAIACVAGCSAAY